MRISVKCLRHVPKRGGEDLRIIWYNNCKFIHRGCSLLGPFVLGVDGRYKLQRKNGEDTPSLCMQLIFAKDVLYNGAGEYSGKEFDIAVQRILRIDERFPQWAE